MEWLHSISAHLWALEQAWVGQPLLIFVPLCLAIPKNARVMQHFRPLLGPQEGMRAAANSPFVPLFGDPGECRGDVAFPPTFGPRRMQR